MCVVENVIATKPHLFGMMMLVCMRRSLRAQLLTPRRGARTRAPPMPTDEDSMSGSSLFKMALVVRTDLGMSRGKIAAQAAHGAVLAIGTAGAATWLCSWMTCGQPKIVLRVIDEASLLAIASAARAEGVPVSLVYDAGRTEVYAGTLTVAAVGPAPSADIDKVTGALKLL